MKANVARALLYLSLPTALVVSIALIFMWWRVPTRVQVDVLVDRATFTIGGEENQRFLNSIPFRSLMADSVTHMVFSPEHLEVEVGEDSDHQLTSREEIETPQESVWQSVTISGFDVRIEGKKENGEKSSSRLTFESWASKEQGERSTVPVRLGRSSSLSIELKSPQADSVFINVTTDTTDATATITQDNDVQLPIGVFGEMSGMPGTSLALEIPRETMPGLLVKVKVSKGETEIEHMIQLYRPFQLIVDNATIMGIDDLPSPGRQALTLRSPTLAFDPTVALRADKEFIVNIHPSQSGTLPLFSRNSSIPITAVAFLQQGPAGEPLTSLVDRGTLRYPEYPQLPSVAFEPPDVLNLGDLEAFVIQRISFDQDRKALRLRLHGMANTISTGSKEFPADHRLTRFDVMWNHEQLWLLGAILVWMIGTSLGFYKFMNDVANNFKK